VVSEPDPDRGSAAVRDWLQGKRPWRIWPRDRKIGEHYRGKLAPWPRTQACLALDDCPVQFLGPPQWWPAVQSSSISSAVAAASFAALRWIGWPSMAGADLALHGRPLMTLQWSSISRCLACATLLCRSRNFVDVRVCDTQSSRLVVTRLSNFLFTTQAEGQCKPSQVLFGAAYLWRVPFVPC
jgi:hypothetical protein